MGIYIVMCDLRDEEAHPCCKVAGKKRENKNQNCKMVVKEDK